MANDGFEDGDYTSDPTWTVYSTAGGPITVVEAAKKVGTYGLRYTGDGGGGTSLTTPVGTDDLDTWTWIRASDVSDSWAGAYAYCKDDLTVIAQIQIKNGALEYLTSGGAQTFTEVPGDNTWYIFRIKYVKATTKVSYYLYDSTSTEIEKHEDETAASQNTIDKIWIQIYDTSSVTDWDEVGYSDSPAPDAPAGTQHMAMRKLW